jgi:hypothetical protein
MYSGWLYAVVANSGNAGIQGVYVTKDFGQNWTKIEIRTTNYNGIRSLPTNSVDPAATATYDFGFNESDYALSLTVDPTNPEVIYLGGSFGGFDESGQPESMIRVDISRLSDANSFFMGNSGNDSGAIQPNTRDVIGLENPVNYGVYPAPAPPYDPRKQTFTNLYRNPAGLLIANSSILVYNTGSLANNGTGARWVPMGNNPSDINSGVSLLGNSVGVPWGSNSYGGNGIQQLLTTVDPLTGRTRVIAVTNTGVYTGLDKGDGTLIRSIGNLVNNNGVNGNQAIPTGSRNGNLQTAQLYSIAAQPSDIAAQVSGSLFYAMTQRSGFPASTLDILNTGDVTWNVPLDPLTGLPIQQLGGGSDVQANPNGGVYDANGNIDSSAMLYQWGWPFDSLNTQTNFFQVGQNYDNAVGRTFGLFQTNQGNRWPDPQWARMDGYKFAVNPINGRQLMIGSTVGRVFATTNAGNFWLPVAEPAAMGNSRSTALAYGAPQTTDSSADTNFYLLNGTLAGRLYVTFTGGGGGAIAGSDWIDRSAGLDGSAIQKIVPNPERGSREAYVVTQRGIFWKADMNSATAWTNLTGNLYSLTSNAFGDKDQQFNLMTRSSNPLTGLVIDWRYVLPDNLANPTGPSHPILYTSGTAGVFRSLDKGTTWTQFPPISDGASAEGGYLPNVIVTDLDIVIGNIDPATGRANAAAQVIDPNTGQPTTANGWNILVASTYGRGAYAIRLAPIIVDPSVFLSVTDPKVRTSGLNPDGTGGSDSGFIKDPLGRLVADNVVAVTDKITNITTPVFEGLSEQSAFGNVVTINLYDLTAYLPTDYVDGNIPVGAPLIGTATTDAYGKFAVQVNAGYFKNDGTTDGLKTVGMQAVNQSSTIGNIVTRQFRLDTTPQAAPAPLVLFDNTSLDNPPDTYTTFKNPRVTINGLESPAPYAPVPGVTSPVLTTFVRLYRGPVDTSDYSINAVAGGAAATGSTSLTLQDPGPLADGVYTYYSVAFDAAGNPSASSAGLTITVDTTTPTAPAPLTLVNNTDVYPANGLSVTNTPPPSITIGGIESFTAGKNGNLVILYRNGVKVTEQRIVGPNTTITLTDPGFLTEGVYSYTATQTDLAGNVSLPSSILTVAIDTTAPAAPAVAALFNNTSNVPSLPGTNTPPPSLTIAGIDQFASTLQVPTGQNGATVYLYRDGLLVNTVAIVSPNTTATVADPTTGLADGTYVYTTAQKDVSGNMGPVSAGFSVIIDTTAPAAPNNLTLVSDTGVIGDNTTNNNKPTFSAAGLDQNVGTTPILSGSAGGPTLILYRNGVEVARKVVTSPATSSEIQDPGPVADGKYTYTVTQIDATGNLSPVGTGIDVTIDTTVPAQPSAPILYPLDDSGIPGDNLTNVTRPRLQGSTSPNFLVRFYELVNGVPVFLGQQRASASGAYLFQVPNTLSDGRHTFYVTVENIAGSVSVPSPNLVITIDTRIPNVPTPTITLDPRDDSGAIGDNTTSVTRPRFYGNAERNQSVDLLIKDSSNPLSNYVVYATTVANFNNNYALQVPAGKALADGVYLVKAQVRTIAGNTADSNILTLTIDTNSPDTPPPPTLQDGDDTGVPGDFVTINRRPTFVSSTPIFTSPAGTIVQLLNDKGTVIGTGTLDANGQYSIQLPQALYNGTISISARLIDSAGNRSAGSSPIVVTIISVADDYNGDGQSDYPLYDRSTNTLKVLYSNSTEALPVYQTANFILPSTAKTIPVSGDFDGDGKADPAVYDQASGTFYIQRSTFGPQTLVFPLTGGKELPFPADFNGDGVTDPAIYDALTQTWRYVSNEAVGVQKAVFGAPNAQPLAADYSGDFKADFGVTYVTGDQRYFSYQDSSTLQTVTTPLGNATSVPVVADYNRDFKADLAVTEVTADNNLRWTISLPGGNVTAVFGASTDIPVPDDYNGDGKAEIATYKPVTTDSNGNVTGGGVWSYEQSPAIPNVVSRSFGIISGVAVNSPLQFRLPPVPVPIQIAAPALYAADDSGTKGDNVTNVAQPRLQGLTKAGYIVRFYEVVAGSPVLLGSQVADLLGAYLFQVPNPLAVGAHSFYVTAQDQTGVVSAPSPILTITIESQSSGVSVPPAGGGGPSSGSAGSGTGGTVTGNVATNGSTSNIVPKVAPSTKKPAPKAKPKPTPKPKAVPKAKATPKPKAAVKPVVKK